MTRYSVIRGFAYNTAQQFAASAVYFACMAWRRDQPVITIDLLNEEVAPADFDIPRNQILLSRCSTALKRSVKNSASVPAVLVEAELRVTFDLSGTTDTKDGIEPPPALPAHIIVCLTDERGHVHEAKLDESVLVQC